MFLRAVFLTALVTANVAFQTTTFSDKPHRCSPPLLEATIHFKRVPLPASVNETHAWFGDSDELRCFITEASVSRDGGVNWETRSGSGPHDLLPASVSAVYDLPIEGDAYGDAKNATLGLTYKFFVSRYNLYLLSYDPSVQECSVAQCNIPKYTEIDGAAPFDYRRIIREFIIQDGRCSDFVACRWVVLKLLTPYGVELVRVTDPRKK